MQMGEGTEDALLCADADVIQRSKKKAGSFLRLQWYLLLSAKTVFSKWRITAGGIRVEGNDKGLRKQP